MKSVVNEKRTAARKKRKALSATVKTGARVNHKAGVALSFSWDVSPAQEVEIVDLTGQTGDDISSLSAGVSAPEVPMSFCSLVTGTLVKL